MPAKTNLPAVTRKAVNIPIAGFKDVYDVEVVDHALAELPASANEALKTTYEKMLKAGGTRLTVKPAGVPAMAHLYDELPNFGEVLDDVRKQIALCASSSRLDSSSRRCCSSASRASARPTLRARSPTSSRPGSVSSR